MPQESSSLLQKALGIDGQFWVGVGRGSSGGTRLPKATCSTWQNRGGERGQAGGAKDTPNGPGADTQRGDLSKAVDHRSEAGLKDGPAPQDK